ncbi:hypothetical protein Tco_0738520 [Tanacetum coccineum]
MTSRSGVAYEGPSIPINLSSKKVVERETEETTDKEQSNFQGSTAHIQPPVNPIPISEPDVSKTLLSRNIPYSSHAMLLKKLPEKLGDPAGMGDQTTRYSSTNDKSVNRIDIIDEVCEEYAPELLGFSNKSSGGNPTPTSEPLTSEFILEEIEAYLKD